MSHFIPERHRHDAALRHLLAAARRSGQDQTSVELELAALELSVDLARPAGMLPEQPSVPEGLRALAGAVRFGRGNRDPQAARLAAFAPVPLDVVRLLQADGDGAEVADGLDAVAAAVEADRPLSEDELAVVERVQRTFSRSVSRRPCMCGRCRQRRR